MPVNHQRDHPYQQWQNENDWERGDGAWGRNKSAKTNEDDRKPGFGEYAGLAYVEVIANKRGYEQDPMGRRGGPISDSRTGNDAPNGTDGERTES